MSIWHKILEKLLQKTDNCKKPTLFNEDRNKITIKSDFLKKLRVKGSELLDKEAKAFKMKICSESKGINVKWLYSLIIDGTKKDS